MARIAEPIPCPACPLRDCSGLRPPDEAQLAYMEAFKSGEIILDRGERLVEQGSASHHLYTLLDGVLMRFRSLEDGRRQIVNIMFPGDLLGLQGAFDEPASHSIEALLPARLCIFAQSEFPSLITAHPRLGYDLVWLAAKEEAALEEHLVALGKRSTRERVVYLAVWLLDRALGTGLAGPGNVLRLPITQTQIGDMLGLSLVHTNRTIRSLMRDGLIEWRPGEIRVPDMERASEFAHFEAEPGRTRPFI